jgi:large subunit ribosomal protein L10
MEEQKKQEKKGRPKREIPQKKLKAVEKLAEDMKKSSTIMILSIRNLPSPQLQKIKKDLRGKAEVQVAKKSIVERAIDSVGIEEMKALKEHLEADTAIALSNEDAFDIAAWLFENRNPIAAKQGQEATDDIKVEAGATDLVPGPDISALGSVGLKVAVEEGKIAIKEPKVVVKKGDVVDENMASVLQKLDIKPFMVGLNPSVIYDSKTKKIYVGVRIDKQEALDNLLTAQSKGLGLAQKLQIITKDTIGYLLAKANAEANALEKLAPKEPAAEEKKEEVKGETTDQNKSEEAKL